MRFGFAESQLRQVGHCGQRFQTVWAQNDILGLERPQFIEAFKEARRRHSVGLQKMLDARAVDLQGAEIRQGH